MSFTNGSLGVAKHAAEVSLSLSMSFYVFLAA